MRDALAGDRLERAGVGHRALDLHVASVDVRRLFGDDAVDRFFEAYGARPDDAAMRFFACTDGLG